MDTIFALASAQGKAGVSVIRVSGDQAHATVELLCGPLPATRKASVRKLQWNGELIDEVIVIIFAKGASFTGEASAELHAHGSRAVVGAILRALAAQPGLRLAEAGEFTRWALDNGRLDLAQVEGLADLIDSETEAQRRQAVRVMSGEIGRKAKLWRRDLVTAASLIEATIDFADEEVPYNVLPEVTVLLDALLLSIRREISGFAAAERIRDGFEVAIVGPPNAGKSTLLNLLAGRDAAITSEIAGTTRDVIEVRMDLGGLAVTVMDTAGLRDAGDVVERIGIERSIARAEAADLRVFLLDDSGPVSFLAARADDIVVRGKADLLSDASGSVSGHTGFGVELLVASITERLAARAASAGLLTSERQRNALVRAEFALESALVAVKDGLAFPELVADELRLAIRALESLVGRIGVENLLSEIFSKFCIGK